MRNTLSFFLMLSIGFLAIGCSSKLESNAQTAAEPPLPIELPFMSGWDFYRFDAGVTGGLSGVPESDWQSIRLPHTANLEPRIVNDQWQGDAFYRKRFDTQPDWIGKTVLLRFEGAMMIANVSLNGQHLVTHKGGYLPFTLDLSDALNPSGTNELIVHLDNRDNSLTGPKPLDILDFNMYGGLYREVRLFVRDTLHITDEMMANSVAGGGLFVTYPEVLKEQAKIAVKTQVRNQGQQSRTFTVVQALMNADTQVSFTVSDTMDIGSGAQIDYLNQIHVRSPRLWSPAEPNLYTLQTRIMDGEQIVDQRDTQIGIRQIDIDADGFRINGESLFLRGVNRHQEYPYVGYALSPEADYRDAKLIKEAGFDYVRLSHYPHSRHFMQAANELGLVLIDAVLGWQYYNADPAFEAHIIQTCRDLIRRDRNHPSVFAWECSLNESAMPQPFIDKLHQAVHEEYPGDQAYSAGWVSEGYDIYLQARQHRLPHPEVPIPNKPYVVSEYGDWEYYAQNAGLNQDSWEGLAEEARTSRQLLAHGEQRLLQQAKNLQEAHNDNFDTPAFADGYWVMFDYNRGYADDLEASGIMSIERIAKSSYHFYRSQRDASEVSDQYRSGPVVHIANEWRQDSPREVRIFSNAREVELFVNGQSLGRRSPDQNRLSTNLRHPPFTFETDKFEPGSLLAVAYDAQGRELARHKVSTPGELSSVEVNLATEGVPLGENDLVFVQAHLVDARGTKVSLTGETLLFEVQEGDAEIVGPSTVLSENGFAAVLLRVFNNQKTPLIKVSLGSDSYTGKGD